MPSFSLAHIREQGQDMLLFPLNSDFDHKTQSEQHAVLAELEMRANEAGLRGHAAAFWERSGRTYHIGPRLWADFLRGVSLSTVLASVNKKISW